MQSADVEIRSFFFSCRFTPLTHVVPSLKLNRAALTTPGLAFRLLHEPSTSCLSPRSSDPPASYLNLSAVLVSTSKRAHTPHRRQRDQPCCCSATGQLALRPSRWPYFGHPLSPSHTHVIPTDNTCRFCSRNPARTAALALSNAPTACACQIGETGEQQQHLEVRSPCCNAIVHAGAPSSKPAGHSRSSPRPSLRT